MQCRERNGSTKKEDMSTLVMERMILERNERYNT